MIRLARFVGEAQIRYRINKSSGSVWICNEISSMGPVIIKLGQFVSTRGNVIDPILAKELVRLQDDLVPVPLTLFGSILDDLPKSWEIDKTPIAVASIGQVHRAFDPGTGKEYIIKLQKPLVSKQISQDLSFIELIVKIQKYLELPKASEYERLLDEFQRFLYTEIDYRQEVKNMQDFAEIDISILRIPMVYEEYCNDKRIVMEYVPSEKITDPLMVPQLIKIYIDTLLEYGIVHGDPHPGNFGVDSDGNIVLYDFGNVIRLPNDFMKNIQQVLFAMIQKDTDEFIEWLITLKIVTISPDHPEDSMLLKPFFQTFFNYLEEVDFNKFKDNMVQIQAPREIIIDPQFIALIRVFSLLDGTCSRLDPNLNYIEILSPYSQNMFMDFNFLDIRARRDFQKFRNPTPTNQDAIITKMNGQVKTINQRQAQLFGLIMIFNIIQNQEINLYEIGLSIAFISYFNKR